MGRVKRADWKVLKSSSLDDNIITQICKSPLIVYDDSFDAMCQLHSKNHPSNLADLYERYCPEIRRVYGDLVALYDTLTLDGLSKNQTDSVFLFLFTDDGVFIRLANRYIEKKLNGSPYAHVQVTLDGDNKIIEKGESVKMEMLFNSFSKTTTVDREALKRLGASFKHMYKVILTVFDTIEHSDLYPVERKSPSTKAGEKGYRPHIEHDRKPWERGDLSTVVYLNKLPLEQNSAQPPKGGTHASPVYHKRKGHYRVLKDEKYENHPDFGKPKWIKPMWVGVDKSTVSGVTYKVLK